jgi:aminoglycoside phosphotransferase (APT) family kinase protein
MPAVGSKPSPSAEFDVTVGLVVALLRSQHPDLADLEVRVVASGWDNIMCRLGRDLAVRLPRRELGAALIEHEQRWLPELAPRLPIPVPARVRVGRAEFGYPWSWSIVPWFDGERAVDAPLSDPTREARRLGGFMSALHAAAPAEAPHNPARDTFAGDRPERFEAALAAVAPLLDELVADGAARVRRRWDALVGTERWTGPRLWSAGDVHSANLIVADGRLRAVIDFGDLCAGDPAVDLAIAWMLFAESDRAVFRDAASVGDAPVDDAMWLRAEGWALYFAVMYLANSADAPYLERMGRNLVVSLLA